MDEALELFAKEGFYSVSISKIAKKAGISKGLMYNYFESKKKLLEEIVNTGFFEFTNVLNLSENEISTKEQFIELINNIILLVKEKANFWRLYFSIIVQNTGFKEMKSKIEETINFYIEKIEGYFISKGSKTPMFEALLFLSMLDGVFFGYAIAPDLYPIEEIKDVIIEKFL